MANNDGERPEVRRPNDTPDLEDELRSIRATGENAGATSADNHDEKDHHE